MLECRPCCSILAPARRTTMFNPTVLEHFGNPHNAGDLPGATVAVEVSNPVCGDVMRLAVRLESGRIVEARFKTQGCVAAIAAGSVLTDLLAGKTPVEAAALSAGEISDALGGLPAASMHAAQLCRDVVLALRREL
jgi:nitrogen fixation protein NifU and related proteins